MVRGHGRTLNGISQGYEFTDNWARLVNNSVARLPDGELHQPTTLRLRVRKEAKEMRPSSKQVHSHSSHLITRLPSSKRPNSFWPLQMQPLDQPAASLQKRYLPFSEVHNVYFGIFNRRNYERFAQAGIP